MTQRTLVAAVLLLALVMWAGAVLIAQSPSAKIWLVSPRQGQTVGGKVLVAAEGAGLPDVQYVIFGVDDERPLASNARPWTWQLDTSQLSDGPHTLLVEAYGRYGILAASQPITVVVRNGAAAPAPPVDVPVEQPAEPPTPPAVDIPVEVMPAVMPAPMDLVASAMEVTLEEETLPLGPALISCPVESMIAAVPEAPAVMTAAVQPVAEVAASTEPVESAGLCVYVNGQPAAVRPVLQGDLAMVPFRALLEAVGGAVSWRHASKQAVGQSATREIVLTLGSRSAQVEGNTVAMPAAAHLSRNRMYAPLRFCMAQLGLEVAWEDGGRISIGAPTTAVARAR